MMFRPPSPGTEVEPMWCTSHPVPRPLSSRIFSRSKKSLTLGSYGCTTISRTIPLPVLVS